MRLFLLNLLLIWVIITVCQEKEDQPEVEIITLDDPVPSTHSTNHTTIESDNNSDSAIITKAFKVANIGFHTLHSATILNNVLMNPESLKHEYQDKYRLLRNHQGYLLATTDLISKDPIPYDAVFLYFDKISLMNENTAIKSLENAMQSLQFSRSSLSSSSLNSSLSNVSSNSTKKPLILFIASKANESKKLFEKLTVYLDAAWTLVEKSGSVIDDITKVIDIQIISVSPTSSTVSEKAGEVIGAIFSRLANETRPLDSLFPTNTFILNSSSSSSSSSSSPISLPSSLEGIGILDQPVISAITLARTALTDSLPRLQKQESGPSLVTFLENLISICIHSLDEDAKRIGVSNPLLLKSAKDDLRRQILSLATNIFRIHVQFARQEVVKKFNINAVEEYVLSPRMSTELRKYRNEAIKSFRKAIQSLTPKNAPISWNSEYDIHQLQETLDDHISRREDLARLDGVLPRGRKPLEISFHTFLFHPLGRDYRQDVILGDNSKDKVFYDIKLAKSKDVIVKPYIARSILKEKFNSGMKLDPLNEKDSEFAREMLMFPLSIKNPAVPLISAKGRRRTIPPKKDPLRVENGPERFIRWDIHPLDEVKTNIDMIQSEYAKSKPTPILDKILNLIPKIGDMYYEPPPLRYGPQFGPSKRSS